MTIHYLHREQNQTMIDLYFFVNPIGSICLAAEEEILAFIDENPDKKFFYHFVPVHNLTVVNNFMASLGIPKSNFKKRKEIHLLTHQVSLIYKAALLQGKKKGHHLLMLIQTEVANGRTTFSLDWIRRIAKEANLDVEMLIEDSQSEAVFRDFQNDQILAKEMHVESTPTLVAFNNANEKYGYRIQGHINFQNIQACIQEDVDKISFRYTPRFHSNPSY